MLKTETYWRCVRLQREQHIFFNSKKMRILVESKFNNSKRLFNQSDAWVETKKSNIGNL